MSKEITKEYLRTSQYKTSKNLDARIAIHQYGSGESFHTWIWNSLELNQSVKILDVGCGTGAFWKENISKLPEGSDLTLTDFSEGMLESAKNKVSGDSVQFRVADIESLPFETDSFDVVMAHHVVYHANDQNCALSELKRVVRSAGIVTVTTNSEKHMLNVYKIGRDLDINFPMDRIIDSFTEEIADGVLPEYFGSVDKLINEDLLKVTDLDVMIGYVKSGVQPRGIELTADFYDHYSQVVKQEIEEKGYFGILKRSPLYKCRVC